MLNFGIRSTTAGRIGYGSSRKLCSQRVCTFWPSPTSGGGSQPQASSGLALGLVFISSATTARINPLAQIAADGRRYFAVTRLSGTSGLLPPTSHGLPSISTSRHSVNRAPNPPPSNLSPSSFSSVVTGFTLGIDLRPAVELRVHQAAAIFLLRIVDLRPA